MGSLLTGLGPVEITFVVVAVLAGGFVKGYSGFGASMMWVASLSLVFPPQRVIPMVLLWEVASSLQLLPAVWRKVEWRPLGWLLLGAGIATPLGVYLLATAPADSIRIGIGLVVVAGSLLIWRGFAWQGRPGPLAMSSVGLAFGLLNGSTALGGPPVVLFYLATPVGAAAGRASIIAFFLATDALAAGLQAAQGVLGSEALLGAGALLPVMLVGVWAGARHFLKTDPDSFKRFSLFLLMGLGVAVLLRALL
jgi:uncharacterized protein